MTTVPLHDLNVVWGLLQSGDLAAAESQCRTLLTHASSAEGFRALAQILWRQGRFSEAPGALETAIRQDPGRADLWSGLGNFRRLQKILPEAYEAYREAARLAPQNPNYVGDLGSILSELGNQTAAESCLRQALRLQPSLASAIRNLCIMLRRQNRNTELEQSLRAEIAARPADAECHFQLGLTLQELSRLDEAEPFLRESVRLRPDNSIAQNQLGTLYWARKQWALAEACFRQALASDPNSSRALSNLGLALHIDNQPVEAEAKLRRALEIEPDYGQAHYNLAMILLQHGRFAEGWPAHEFRTKPPERPDLFPQPLWDGRPLHGERVLVHAEQGRGDMMQFVRFGAYIKERGGQVVVGCPPALVPLFSSCPYVDEVCGGTPLPNFDLQIAMLSLPMLAGTTMENIPGQVPYLFAEPGLVQTWRERLAGVRDFKIGIAWQGAATFTFDPQRSIALPAFEPLARVPGVKLFSLQKGLGTEQLAGQALHFAVTDLGTSLDEHTGAFQESAAVMKNLDLVITSDTALAHLAGALSVPVWVALGIVPNWRWLLEREDSPWYPTMRLFRQQHAGDWTAVFERMAAELRTMLSIRAPVRPLLAEVSAGELLDKISILEIKSRRIQNPDKLINIGKELAALKQVETEHELTKSSEAQSLVIELRAINEGLWDTEDALRDCERQADFGDRFVELARSVYLLNDKRSDAKRRINRLLGSTIVEEKSYGESQPGK